MLRKLFIWGCVAVFCFFLTYIIWVLVAMNRTATISVDYVALLNEKAAAIPKEQRAWPLVRGAGVALRKWPMPSEVYIEEEIEEPNWPNDAGWNHMHDWLDQHSETLKTLRKASALQGMGYILDGTIAKEDKELWPEEYESQQALPPHDGFLVSILLPQLGPMRRMAMLLATDAKDAVAKGDAERCQADLRSMLSVGIYVREHPLLINDLVSFSIFNMTFETLETILDREPDLFSNAQLGVLASQLHGLTDNLAIRFDGERWFMLDLLQRIYTDDGNGDGSIVPIDAGKAFLQLEAASVESKSSSLFPVILAPVADICFASRKEMLEEYNRRLAHFEQFQEEALLDVGGEYTFPVQPWIQASSVIDPFFLTELLTPAYNRAIEHAVKTRNSRDDIINRIHNLQNIE